LLKKDVSETWSLQTFEKKLIELIRALKHDNREINQNDLHIFFEELLSTPLIESELFYEIYGVEMSIPQKQFGNFTIYKFDLAIDDLTKKYPRLENRKIYFSTKKPNYLVGIKVKAREDTKAIEMANRVCETIENAFNYMIADLTHMHAVGIINYRGWRTTNVVICNDSSTGGHFHRDINLPVNIDDAFFSDAKSGNDKIWLLITKHNKTDLENRIINSIDWIGKAITDVDLSKALVQFVFAIEGMLQLNEKNIITPSIISQLSDWLAFIISDELDDRKNISKYFKDIYQKRSAIAHGALKVIDIKDLSIALEICKQLIIAFLVSAPFSNMKTIEELGQYMTYLKFK